MKDPDTGVDKGLVPGRFCSGDVYAFGCLALYHRAKLRISGAGF